MPKQADYLSPEQVREQLGISEPTYYRWLREGRLKGVKVGRRWRFPRGVIQALHEDPNLARDRKEGLAAALEALSTLCGKEAKMLTAKSASDSEAVVSLLLNHALKRQASDLHLEPVADGLAVRERVDGILRPVGDALPRGAQDDVVTTLKRMAGFDLTVTAQPQDAKFFHDHEGRKVDVYLTSYPTALGESLTLRLLDPANVSLSFGKTGFSKRLQDGVRHALRAGRGVFLIDGPTGSGKTTTAYTLLTELNKPGVKIMTAEDPVEFRINGILQAPVRPPFTFPSAMRAMLRASVDIGYVGEMRDTETLDLLLTMAATGHKMFSCLHVGDAVSALARVMQVTSAAPLLVADNLLGILNQRLVPLSCARCRKLEVMSKADARRLGVEPFKVAVNTGCDACGNTGIRGRTAVGELLTITPGLRKALLAGVKDPDELRKAMQSAWPGIREDVLERLRAGDVHVEHALAVLNA